MIGTQIGYHLDWLLVSQVTIQVPTVEGSGLLELSQMILYMYVCVLS